MELSLFMRGGISGECALTEAELHENPLVPNKKLRQMYVAMVEARVLDERIGSRKAAWNAGVKAKRRLTSTRGEEACRVSTAIDLGSGDLVSDSQSGVVMELIAGARVESLLRRLKEGVAIERAGHEGAGQLPWVKDAGERLRLALGAALALKMLKRERVVVAYVRHGEVGKSEWGKILEMAARLELPIFFVVLPAGARAAKKHGVKQHGQTAKLCARARSCGVPGMLVDASDAVAIYRVAQETMGRLRGGGGPVLVECAEYEVEGTRGSSLGDPVLQMGESLLKKNVATKEWLDGAGDRLRRQIEATKL